MKKIINPWKGLEGYNCFGCASNNEAGLKMEFYDCLLYTSDAADE